MGILVSLFNKVVRCSKTKNSELSKVCNSATAPIKKEQAVVFDNPLWSNSFIGLKHRILNSRIKTGASSLKLDLENSFILTPEQYDFFTYGKKNLSPKIVHKNLEEIIKMRDKYGDRIFLSELGHRRAHNARALLQTRFENPELYNDLINLLKLSNSGEIKYIPRFIMPEGKLNPLVKKDLDALLNGKNYFEEFSMSVSKPEILSKTAEGDAFSIGEKMYVRTQKGYDKLDLDKNTYKLLFPPVDRYAITQGHSLNCGPLSVINNLIQVPSNRVKFYKLFSQKGNSIVVHSLGNSFNKSVFELDELKKLDNGIFSETCYGIKMLEAHSNKSFDIFYYGIVPPMKGEKYFCKDIICKKGSVYMNKSEIKDAVKNESIKDLEKLKDKIRTIGRSTTMVSGGGSLELGTGRHHYISVFDCTDDIVRFANPEGTAMYREMPLDDFIKKVCGHSFYHNL